MTAKRTTRTAPKKTAAGRITTTRTAARAATLTMPKARATDCPRGLHGLAEADQLACTLQLVSALLDQIGTRALICVARPDKGNEPWLYDTVRKCWVSPCTVL